MSIAYTVPSVLWLYKQQSDKLTPVSRTRSFALSLSRSFSSLVFFREQIPWMREH